MVINWEANLQKCLDQKKVVPTFHASTIEKHIQKVYLTQMMLKKHMSHEEIHEWYKIALGDVYDSGYVNRLILSASRTRRPRQRDYKIYITPKEITYINKLPYDREFRAYLLSLVCFCKFMQIKKGIATVRARDKSYIYYLSSGEDNYSIGKQRHSHIEEQYRDCLKSKILTLKTIGSTFKASWGGNVSRTNIVIQAKWIDWEAQDGILIDNPDAQMPLICKKYIKEDKCVCSECGKTYTRSSKAKTTLCPKCYAKQRKLNVRNNVRRLRENKKLDAIEEK